MKLNGHNHAPSPIWSENYRLLCRRLDQLMIVSSSHSRHRSTPTSAQRIFSASVSFGCEGFRLLLPLYDVEYEAGL